MRTDETTDDRTADTMGIREMCDAYDVTPRTLRFYESKGLLAPVRIGTRRLFTRRDRARLKLILRGRRFGFSLDEIGELLDLYDLGDGQKTQINRSLELASAHLVSLERRRRDLDEAIAELKELMNWGAGLLGRTKAARPGAGPAPDARTATRHVASDA